MAIEKERETERQRKREGKRDRWREKRLWEQISLNNAETGG